MKHFYNQLAEDLIGTLEKYANGEATYEELWLAFLKEDLAFNHKKWEEIERDTRNEIFELENQMLSHLSSVEVKLKNIEREIKGVDVSIEGLTSHSRMISRNKMPLEGYNNSTWYLPFCPNHNHIESLYEDSNKADEQ